MSIKSEVVKTFHGVKARTFNALDRATLKYNTISYNMLAKGLRGKRVTIAYRDRTLMDMHMRESSIGEVMEIQYGRINLSVRHGEDGNAEMWVPEAGEYVPMDLKTLPLQVMAMVNQSPTMLHLIQRLVSKPFRP